MPRPYLCRGRRAAPARRSAYRPPDGALGRGHESPRADQAPCTPTLATPRGSGPGARARPHRPNSLRRPSAPWLPPVAAVGRGRSGEQPTPRHEKTQEGTHRPPAPATDAHAADEGRTDAVAARAGV